MGYRRANSLEYPIYSYSSVAKKDLVFGGYFDLGSQFPVFQEGLDRTCPLELFPKGFKGIGGGELDVVLGSGHFSQLFAWFSKCTTHPQRGQENGPIKEELSKLGTTLANC